MVTLNYFAFCAYGRVVQEVNIGRGKCGQLGQILQLAKTTSKMHLVISSDKVLLPALYIKLGLMKQFVIALDKEGDCFKYLGQNFPN